MLCRSTLEDSWAMLQTTIQVRCRQDSLRLRYLPVLTSLAWTLKKKVTKSLSKHISRFSSNKIRIEGAHQSTARKATRTTPTPSFRKSPSRPSKNRDKWAHRQPRRPYSEAGMSRMPGPSNSSSQRTRAPKPSLNSGRSNKRWHKRNSPTLPSPGSSSWTHPKRSRKWRLPHLSLNARWWTSRASMVAGRLAQQRVKPLLQRLSNRNKTSRLPSVVFIITIT